jgi:hypothetical protein
MGPLKPASSRSHAMLDAQRARGITVPAVTERLG